MSGTRRHRERRRRRVQPARHHPHRHAGDTRKSLARNPSRRSEAETLGMPAGGRGSNNERMFRPAPLIPNSGGSVEESASRFKRLSASQPVQGYHLRYGASSISSP